MSASKISLDEVRRIAHLARLSPSASEAEALRVDLDAILEYVALLDEVDTENVEPTSHPVALGSQLRADEVRASLPRDEALAAAPASRDGGFAMPKVLEVES